MPSDIIKLEPMINHDLMLYSKYGRSFTHWAIILFILFILCVISFAVAKVCEASYIPHYGETTHYKPKYSAKYICIRIWKILSGILIIGTSVGCILTVISIYDTNPHNNNVDNNDAFVTYTAKSHIAHAKTENERMKYDKILIHKNSIHSAYYTDASHDHYRQKQMYKKNIKYVRKHSMIIKHPKSEMRELQK